MQGDTRVVTLVQAEWARRLTCTVGTMSRKIQRMEQQGRLRCLTPGTRGGRNPYMFEVRDPADFDVEQES
jgi:DNA-binding MarR family transcriptional regulator